MERKQANLDSPVAMIVLAALVIITVRYRDRTFSQSGGVRQRRAKLNSIYPGHEAFTPPPVSHPRIVTQNSRYDVHRDFGEVLQLFWRFCDRHFILLASPKGL